MPSAADEINIKLEAATKLDAIVTENSDFYFVHY